MIIPLDITCPHCKVEGVENFNMIISIRTEQPLSYFRSLPKKIELSPKTSGNSSWVDWYSKDNIIVCQKCRYSSFDSKDFSK